MNTELAPRAAANGLPPLSPARYTIGDIQTMAETVAASGLFPGVTTARAAFALMMLCQADGLHPMTALKRYHIIEGRPSMRADAMQAEFQSRGGWVRWTTFDDTEAVAVFGHRVHCPEGVEVRATLREFEESGITTSWDKDAKKLKPKKNWKQNPGAMLRARLISRGVRMVDPGAIVGTYTPEEVADFDAGDLGPEATSEPVASQAPFHQNGSGHGQGSYPSPEDEKKYGRVINKFVQQFNADFVAKWIEPDGTIVPGISDPISWFSVNGAMIHAVLEDGIGDLDPEIDPTKLKTRQKEGYNALAFLREPERFKAGLVAYARDKAHRVAREWHAKNPGLRPECLGFEELTEALEDEALSAIDAEPIAAEDVSQDLSPEPTPNAGREPGEEG